MQFIGRSNDSNVAPVLSNGAFEHARVDSSIQGCIVLWQEWQEAQPRCSPSQAHLVAQLGKYVRVAACDSPTCRRQLFAQLRDG
eukprot:1858443-Pleurochrysis_carterae.AAC.4